WVISLRALRYSTSNSILFFDMLYSDSCYFFVYLLTAFFKRQTPNYIDMRLFYNLKFFYVFSRYNVYLAINIKTFRMMHQFFMYALSMLYLWSILLASILENFSVYKY